MGTDRSRSEQQPTVDRSKSKQQPATDCNRSEQQPRWEEKGLTDKGVGEGTRRSRFGTLTEVWEEDAWLQIWARKMTAVTPIWAGKTTSVGKKDADGVLEDGSRGGGDADGVTEMEKNDVDGVTVGRDRCRRGGEDGCRRRRRRRR
ncbi:hypothetical protein ACLOJK_028366 [Asimina triloba]